MNTTRYLIHTLGDQSLTAIAFVIEDPSLNKANILILPVNLIRSAGESPIISFSETISEDVPFSGTHESMCLEVMRKAGIPRHHQVIFHKVPEPMSFD